VVALDAAGLLDPVLALGLRPVGAAQVAKGRFPTVLMGRTDGIEPVGVNAEPNVETIASLAPDCIVGFDFSFGEAREQISAIAPTIAFAETVTWQRVLDTLARVLDRREERDAWVRRVRTGVREVRRVADGASVAVITDADGGNFFLSGPRYDTSALLERAGMDVLTLEDPAEDFGNGVIAVSDERLGELDADHLVVVTYEPDPAKRVNAFEQNPLWPRLRAVRAGDAHVIDGSTWNNFGPIAIVAMLREAVDLFAGR
jgi:iron complex transport system substrate-binding protein